MYIYGNLTYLFRETSSGTKSPIVLDHGYLQRRAETSDTRNHGQHLFTAARHITNQGASHRHLLNSECIPHLDTSLVAICINCLSTQWPWQKLRRCRHRHRSLFFLDLERAVQDVLLHSADLNSITKREIRCQLEGHVGMSHKAVINAAIQVDRTLLDQNLFHFIYSFCCRIVLSFQ